ncbi:hypothetical protein D3C86_1825970 [compost metagenome]
MLIEAEGLGILLVDIHPSRPLPIDSVSHQQAADPAPSRLGGDEEHLDVAIVHAAKTCYLLLLSPGANQIHCRKIVLQDQGFEGDDIRLLQEVMGGAHRGLPKSDQGLVIRGLRLFNLHDVVTQSLVKVGNVGPSVRGLPWPRPA